MRGSAAQGSETAAPSPTLSQHKNPDNAPLENAAGTAGSPHSHEEDQSAKTALKTLHFRAVFEALKDPENAENAPSS